MGLAVSCLTKVPSLERLEYDMAPWRNRNLPVIWLTGQQNTGKKTHGNFIKDTYNYEHISITQLLRDEAKKDTERGRLINEALNSKKNIPDDIVLDLLKEALLNSLNETGFVISNFPKNEIQAELFLKEIGNVSFILYLHSDTSYLIDRALKNAEEELNEEILRRDITFATRDIKMSLVKYTTKTENIDTNGQPEDVFESIEGVFTSRLNIKKPIVATETDYVRAPNIQYDEF